jgi:hypothetical protein
MVSLGSSQAEAVHVQMQRMQPAGICSLPHAITQLISIFLAPSGLYISANL